MSAERLMMHMYLCTYQSGHLFGMGGTFEEKKKKKKEFAVRSEMGRRGSFPPPPKSPLSPYTVKKGYIDFHAALSGN